MNIASRRGWIPPQHAAARFLVVCLAAVFAVAFIDELECIRKVDLWKLRRSKRRLYLKQFEPARVIFL